MIAAAVRMVLFELLTREQIVLRLEAAFGPRPFGHLDTLSVALKQERGIYVQAQPPVAQKKRSPEAFAMKQTTLDKLQQAAREDAIRLLYLDEAGFCGSPLVKRSQSSRGLPHEIEPNTHCRRSVPGVLDYGANKLIHAIHGRCIKDPNVVRFVGDLLAMDDGRPTVIVLDNASIHMDRQVGRPFSANYQINRPN